MDSRNSCQIIPLMILTEKKRKTHLENERYPRYAAGNIMQQSMKMYAADYHL